MNLNQNLIEPGPRTVNLEQLKAAIDFEKAQIQLHSTALEAWNKRGEYERSYTRHVYSMTVQGPVRPDSTVPYLENYLKWHKQYYESEARLRELQIAQFKSHLFIQERMLEEAQKPKLFEGGNMVTS